MKTTYRYAVAVLGFGIALSACKKKSTTEAEPELVFPPQGKTKYIVTATPIATTGVADYLLTADDLSTGSITTVGNGLEQDGTYRYYATHKGKFFSLLYGQGNPGAVTTYGMTKEGKLSKTSDFQSETVQVFCTAGNDLVTIKVPRSGTNNALAFRIDADQAQIVAQKEIDVVQLAANGERAHFTWARQVGNKIFAPYQSIKGCCGTVWNTDYPDSSWIAVFSYPDLNLEKVIRDTLTSFIGSYFNDGLAIDEKGDVYAFSPGYILYGNTAQVPTKKPSAFVKIPAGTTDYDRSYFFDVEAASGGHKVSRQTYLSGGKVLLYMYGDKNAATGNVKMAIADLYSKSFTWITGLPDILSHSSSYNNNTITADGKIFLGVNTVDESRIYTINIASASASAGLKVEGGKITSLLKMEY